MPVILIIILLSSLMLFCIFLWYEYMYKDLKILFIIILIINYMSIKNIMDPNHFLTQLALAITKKA